MQHYSQSRDLYYIGHFSAVAIVTLHGSKKSMDRLNYSACADVVVQFTEGVLLSVQETGIFN